MYGVSRHGHRNDTGDDADGSSPEGNSSSSDPDRRAWDAMSTNGPGYGRTDGERAVSPTDEAGRSVSVVVPTYNERENVRAVVDRCSAALAGYDFEIVVVDDDSPDGTWHVVRETYADTEWVRVVRREGKFGLATAVSRGFREASTELCAVIDADLQHPPEKLPALIDAFDPGVDVVIGSRYTAGGAIEGWSPGRRLVSRGASAIARVGLPATRGVADPLSGFFAVRRDLLDGVRLSPIGYKILLEVLAKCEYGRVVEVPYVFREREKGESKLTAREYWEFLGHVGALRLAHARDSSPVPGRGSSREESDVLGD